MKNVMKGLAVVGLLAASAGASAEIVVVVHPEHPLASMTAEQVADVYLGKDPNLRLIDLPETARQRHWFYSKVTGRDVTQIRMLRARHMATMRAPKVAANSAEAVRLVAANKNAIAYVDERAVDASVKAVMLVEEPAVLKERVASD